MRSPTQSCPNQQNHTVEPMPKSDYLGWHRWAEKMSQTHKQTQCPDCQKWAIWIPKSKEENDQVS